MACNNFSAWFTDNSETDESQVVKVRTLRWGWWCTQPAEYSISWPRLNLGCLDPRCLVHMSVILSLRQWVFPYGAWSLQTCERGLWLACISFLPHCCYTASFSCKKLWLSSPWVLWVVLVVKPCLNATSSKKCSQPTKKKLCSGRSLFLFISFFIF